MGPTGPLRWTRIPLPSSTLTNGALPSSLTQLSPVVGILQSKVAVSGVKSGCCLREGGTTAEAAEARGLIQAGVPRWENHEVGSSWVEPLPGVGLSPAFLAQVRRRPSAPLDRTKLGEELRKRHINARH